MGSVVYLDTGNSFSPQRVTHFVCQHSDPAGDQVKHIITFVLIFLLIYFPFFGPFNLLCSVSFLSN
jgi:hypothetical protein